MEDLQRLDKIVETVARGGELPALSTSECMYVAVASNRPELLGGDTIAVALGRIGKTWLAHLVERWSSAPNPKYDAAPAADPGYQAFPSRPPTPTLISNSGPDSTIREQLRRLKK
ncbi:MAG: hypothetical protein U1F54_16745 [Burkholderiales bacterium]